MNIGLVRKTAADTFPVLVFTGCGSVLFIVLFSWAMVNMGTEILAFVGKIPMLKSILEMSLGIQVTGDVSVNILFAVSLTHLATLALAWALIISTITRTTVGEVERGTADLLLTLPVSRWNIFVSVSVVWLVASAIISLCPLLGIWLGKLLFAGSEEVHIGRFIPAICNLFAIHLAIGCITALVSVSVNRRGIAVGLAVAIVLTSAMLNFVEPFVPALHPLRWVNLLYYFRPVDVVRNEVWPIASICTMIAFALVSWMIAALIFSRRDIPAG